MKTKKKLYRKVLIVAFTLCNLCSCNYLDVSDELAGNLQSLDEIFDNVAYTKRWYANIFTATLIIRVSSLQKATSQASKTLGLVCVTN